MISKEFTFGRNRSQGILTSYMKFLLTLTEFWSGGLLVCRMFSNTMVIPLYLDVVVYWYGRCYIELWSYHWIWVWLCIGMMDAIVVTPLHLDVVVYWYDGCYCGHTTAFGCGCLLVWWMVLWSYYWIWVWLCIGMMDAIVVTPLHLDVVVYWYGG